MLTGRRFKLERATLALTMMERRRKALTIPVGAVIKVMVDVLWEGQSVAMFAVDVNVRGTEIVEHENRDAGAGASL